MSLHPGPFVASLLVLAAVALPSADARACGGCFVRTETQGSVVTGHRMAFAVSTTQSVLWDQIQYSGSPSDFAWVLPVHGGAVLQLSNDAWFETLDAATSAQIISPPINCGGSSRGGCSIGCASSSASDKLAGTGGPDATPPVTVTHQGTVGPYQTVTLHANVPDALPNWLTTNGYAIDPSIAPLIDAYTSEGFDFIALRLSPGMGVQEMKPVRVVTPGMSPTLPLRMVAAGTGPNVAMTLFILGEGRWEAQNFPNGEVDASTLTWDFGTQSSNYAEARLALLATHGGTTWNNAYAEQGALLSPVFTNGSSSLSVGGQFFQTIGEAYVAQGLSNGETSDGSCSAVFDSIANSTSQVVECSSGFGGAGTGGAGTGGAGTGGAGGGTPSCSDLPLDEIDDSQLACGNLDDIAVAMLGLHPADVWLTRLEANLPRAALANDLDIQAASVQAPLTNVFSVTQSKGDPCASGAIGGGGGSGRGRALRNQLAMVAAIVAAVGAALGRRRRVPVSALGA